MKQGFIGLLLGILIVAANGTVEVQRNNVWVPIAAGAQLNDGDHVRTGAGSSATLDLGTGTMITLSQASEIQVRQAPDLNVRTYTADARSFYQGEPAPSSPTYYLSPYLCTNPQNGVPPVPPSAPKR